MWFLRYVSSLKTLIPSWANNSVVIKKERIMPTGLLQIHMEKALQLPARPLPLFKEMSRPYVTKAVIPE